jgi:hypothetical protein
LHYLGPRTQLTGVGTGAGCHVIADHECSRSVEHHPSSVHAHEGGK